jgi:hypothetical protein
MELEERLTQYYGAAGQEFLQSSQSFHDQFRKSAGLEAAEQIVLMSNHALAGNSGYLVPLQTVEELQAASGRYLTYLMANPNVTQLYYDNRIDGYGELFLDPEPKLVGESRNAYRAVVSGVGTSYYNYDHEEAENETWITYSNNESDEGMPLLPQEQYNVINAWKLQDLPSKLQSCPIQGARQRPTRGKALEMRRLSYIGQNHGMFRADAPLH